MDISALRMEYLSLQSSTKDGVKLPWEFHLWAVLTILHIRLRVSEPRKDMERCPNNIFET